LPAATIEAPRIHVLAPAAGHPLIAPFPIHLRFVAATGREIEFEVGG
jgi:hypothetical protein